MSKRKPTVALMYDFDKTLCTKDMQEYSFIPKVRMSPAEFWQEANILASERRMDRILAYMYLMLDKSMVAKKSILREDFVALGRDLEFFPGVEDWFVRVDGYGREEGVQIEHYIISSGLREIIEGSRIFGAFQEVFACEFLYNENGIACWPKNVVNYTTKTQFLYRINKGVFDLSDDTSLNRYVAEDERPVPFRNMIYIGDGLTDVPCMKLVKVNGGHSIAVHAQPGKRGRQKVQELLRDGRVDFLALADYGPGGELDGLVRSIIRKIALVDELKQDNLRQRKSLQA